jgi:transcriptional regulator with XRE-family HTH domain
MGTHKRRRDHRRCCEICRYEGGKIEAWEGGADKPTINQLYKLAEKYKRPISVFYLSKPPKDFQALQDFRRIADAMASSPSSRLAYEIRISQERRLLALDLYRELSQTPTAFRFLARRDQSVSHVAARLRELLGISAETQAKWRDARLAYNAWRTAVEKQGILVFQVSGIDLAEIWQEDKRSC